MRYKINHVSNVGFFVTDGTINLVNGVAKDEAEDVVKILNSKDEQIRDLVHAIEIIKKMFGAYPQFDELPHNLKAAVLHAVDVMEGKEVIAKEVE